MLQVRLSHTLAATPAAKPHDAFDREDFDAIQYINEMFPNGERSSDCTLRFGRHSMCRPQVTARRARIVSCRQSARSQ